MDNEAKIRLGMAAAGVGVLALVLRRPRQLDGWRDLFDSGIVVDPELVERWRRNGTADAILKVGRVYDPDAPKLMTSLLSSGRLPSAADLTQLKRAVSLAKRDSPALGDAGSRRHQASESSSCRAHWKRWHEGGRWPESKEHNRDEARACPSHWRRFHGGELAAVGGRSRRGYYTVVIPPVEEGYATQWHSATLTLTRGAFDTKKAATEWAKKHLGGHRFRIEKRGMELGGLNMSCRNRQGRFTRCGRSQLSGCSCGLGATNRFKYNAKANKYKYFVVWGSGWIESGWEYKEDALEKLRDLRAGGYKSTKVLQAAALRRLGRDPDDNANWQA